MKKIILILVLIFCFSCKEETKEKMVATDEIVIDTLLQLKKADKIESLKLKKLDERYYHITLYDYESSKDTIVNFDFLENDDMLNFTFNYESFEKKSYQDSVSLLTTNIEVVIVKSKFDISKSKVKYAKDSTTVIEIDGHGLIGAEEIPNTYISKMYLNLSGNYFEIEKEYYEDLYEPDFNRIKAYYYDKEIIIDMNNSDGYLGYSVILFIDNEMNMKRIVYMP